MAKFFETSDEFVEMVENQFSKTGLDMMGINIKVVSITKAKDILKVSRASAVTNFLTQGETDILVTVYEQALDRLSRDMQEMLIEMVLSNVAYDTDKDKLLIETNPYIQVFNMRRKYGEKILDILETSYLTIQQIEDEEKERKEQEKEAKKAKKNN